MAITQRYSTNAAVQYNESLADYLITDTSTGKKFLTEAPLNRLIRENELSALYFLIDDAGFNGATILRFKDEDGNLLFEDNTNIATTHNIHNGLLIGFTGVPYYVPENTRKICALISGSPNLFLNPDFSQGSGNLFTSWTLTQPSRTNLILQSQDFATTWGSSAIVTTNTTVAPDGTLTADTLNDNSNVFLDKRQTTTLSVGTLYSQSVYIKKTIGALSHYPGIGISLDGGFLVSYAIFNTTDGTSSVDPSSSIPIFSITSFEEGEYWRFVVTFNTDIYTSCLSLLYPAISTDGTSINSNAQGTNVFWGAQLEQSSQATPYIPTTTASVTTSLGEFLQDATGGINGGRCLKMWASTGSTSLQQSKFLTDGVQYKVSFWARVDKLYGNDYLTGPADANLILSTEWTYYEQIPFTQVGSGTEVLLFNYTNDANYGFVYLDKMSIVNADENALTEERCFELDTRCFANENQIQWINKLGGVDTWTFTGNPIETRNTEREGLIEYPMQDNYQATNEIYAYRSIKSHEVMNLFHRCDNEETAIWLRSELQDCIQAYLKIGDDFHPIIPTTSSVQLRNYAQRDPNVRFSFRFAYDINIQRR